MERLAYRLLKLRLPENQLIGFLQATSNDAFPVYIQKNAVASGAREVYRDTNSLLLSIDEFCLYIENDILREEAETEELDEMAAKCRNVFARLKASICEVFDESEARLISQIIKRKPTTEFFDELANGMIDTNEKFIQRVENYLRLIASNFRGKRKATLDNLKNVEEKAKEFGKHVFSLALPDPKAFDSLWEQKIKLFTLPKPIERVVSPNSSDESCSKDELNPGSLCSSVLKDKANLMMASQKEDGLGKNQDSKEDSVA